MSRFGLARAFKTFQFFAVELLNCSSCRKLFFKFDDLSEAMLLFIFFWRALRVFLSSGECFFCRFRYIFRLSLISFRSSGGMLMMSFGFDSIVILFVEAESDF